MEDNNMIQNQEEDQGVSLQDLQQDGRDNVGQQEHNVHNEEHLQSTGYSEINSFQDNGYQNNGYFYNNGNQNSSYSQNNSYQGNSYQQNMGYPNSTYPQNNYYTDNGYGSNGQQTYNNSYQPYRDIPPYTDNQLELEEPVKLSEWIVSLLLMMIPCVNIILMFVWAFSSTEKKSKSNYFKAALIVNGIMMGLMFLLWVAIIIFAAALY